MFVKTPPARDATPSTIAIDEPVTKDYLLSEALILSTPQGKFSICAETLVVTTAKKSRQAVRKKFGVLFIFAPESQLVVIVINGVSIL